MIENVRTGVLYSPGAVDMAGVVITPGKAIFSSVTASEMDDICRSGELHRLYWIFVWPILKKGHQMRNITGSSRSAWSSGYRRFIWPKVFLMWQS